MCFRVTTLIGFYFFPPFLFLLKHAFRKTYCCIDNNKKFYFMYVFFRSIFSNNFLLYAFVPRTLYKGNFDTSFMLLFFFFFINLRSWNSAVQQLHEISRKLGVNVTQCIFGLQLLPVSQNRNCSVIKCQCLVPALEYKKNPF